MKKTITIILALLVLLSLTGCGGSNSSNKKTYDTIEEQAFYDAVYKGEDSEVKFSKKSDWLMIDYNNQKTVVNTKAIVEQGISDFVEICKPIFEEGSITHIQINMKAEMTNGDYHSATSFTATKDEFEAIDWDSLKGKTGIYNIMENGIERCYVNNDISKEVDLSEVRYR